MGGFKRILFRIIPIFTLICFICLGITYTFSSYDANGNSNITYLSKEKIPINNEEKTIYKFAVNEYVQNIDVDVLKRGTTNAIDLQTYRTNLDSFNVIWEDGYNFGDGIHTIINAIILTINTIIMPINIFLIPLRVISGILLTAFAIVGIKTTGSGTITTTLNIILDNLAIPFIQPTFNRDVENNLLNSTWYFNTDINATSRTTNVQFESMGITYTKLDIYKINSDGHIYTIITYIDADNNYTQVYSTLRGGWIYESARTIEITGISNTSNIGKQYLARMLQSNAMQIGA